MEYSIYKLGQLIAIFKTLDQAYEFTRKLPDALVSGDSFFTILREPEKYKIKELNIATKSSIWADLDTFLYLCETEGITDLS